MLGKQLRNGASNVADAERIDEPRERARLAGLDGSQQIVDFLLAKAFQ